MPQPAGRRPDDRPYDSAALTQYLGEVGAHPLVSRDEELRLARRIADGDGEALDTLVRANLRFVISVAKRYRGQGVPLLDVIAEGNFGLIRAAHKFDPDQGVRFISYAVWWIRQAILQALAEQSRVVRVPLNRAGALHRLARRAAALEQRLGREPTAAEIAEGTGLTAAEVTGALAVARAPLSLDAPLAPDGETALIDQLADDGAPPPDAPVLDRALAEAVHTSLATLAPRDRTVLRLYFGFDEEPMTLEQIGAVLGITGQRVGKIKDRALARLRHCAVATALAQFHGAPVRPIDRLARHPDRHPSPSPVPPPCRSR